MVVEIVTKEQLINKLCEITGFDQKSLAKKIGVTEQTMSRWMNEPLKRISSSSINKLGEAMRQNDWGIKLGNVTRSKIEIINSGGDTSTSSNREDDNLLKEVLKENFLLKKENLILKEKLQQYEARK